MTDPIIGFRCWNGGALEEPKHPAPADNCRCGLHARTTLQGCLEEYPYYPVHGYWGYMGQAKDNFMVMGAVLMWGDIHRGDKVIRASHSRVLCLTDKDNPWPERTGSLNPADIAQEKRDVRTAHIGIICQQYGIPLVPFDTCEIYASEFGEYVGPRRSQD